MPERTLNENALKAALERLVEGKRLPHGEMELRRRFLEVSIYPVGLGPEDFELLAAIHLGLSRPADLATFVLDREDTVMNRLREQLSNVVDELA